MVTSPVVAVDHVILRQRKRLSAMERIKQVIADDPDFLNELRILVFYGQTPQITDSASNGNECALVGVAMERPTHFERIKRYLLEHGNEWCPTPRLINDTGLSRASVSQIIYKDRREFFERGGGGKTKSWRLRIEAGITPSD